MEDAAVDHHPLTGKGLARDLKWDCEGRCFDECYTVKVYNEMDSMPRNDIEIENISADRNSEFGITAAQNSRHHRHRAFPSDYLYVEGPLVHFFIRVLRSAKMTID